jgi:ADP-heptose:LPS heptosyltransferase
MIVAGGSSHRPGKRWPASHYGTLCNWLVGQGITPVLIGTRAEGTVISTIESLCPAVINLVGETGFEEVAQLGRGAFFAVGNDTGPMHLISTSGAPSIVLFSDLSDPALCAPRGQKVIVLRATTLCNLMPQTVINEIKKLL